MAERICNFCKRQGFICERPFAVKPIVRLEVEIPSRRQKLVAGTIEECAKRCQILQNVGLNQ